MQFHQALRQRQAESDAPQRFIALPISLLELFKNLFLFGFVNAHAMIGNRHPHLAIGGLHRRQCHGTLGGRVFQRVGQKVQENLPRAAAIRLDDMVATGHPHFEANRLLLGLGRDHERRRLQEFLNADAFQRQFHRAHFDLGQVQHVIDKCEQMGAAVVDAPHILLLLLIERAKTFPFEQVGKAYDRVQRCAQLVAHRREEMALVLVGFLEAHIRPLDAGQRLQQVAGPLFHDPLQAFAGLGQFRGSDTYLGIDNLVGRLQLRMALCDLFHLADALAARGDQDEILEKDPGGMLEPAPVACSQYAKYRLGPEHAA